MVLLVAASSAGSAAGTPSPEPACESVERQLQHLAAALEEAAAHQRDVDRAALADGTTTPDERAARRAASTEGQQRMLQLQAYALTAPRCSTAQDLELARQAVRQLVPELAGN